MRGHVRAVGEGKFRVFIHVGKGRYQSYLVKGTKRAAERACASFIHERSQGTLVEPAKMTVAALLEKWISSHAQRRVAAKTAERYREIIDKHLVPALGHYQLTKLHALHIEQYYTTALMSGRRNGRGGLAARTVLHHHRVLREALQRAVRWRLLARNPAADVDAPHPRPVEIKALDDKELHALFKGFEGTRLYAPMVTAATTGIRRGELLALRWSDISLDDATLTVARSLEETKFGLVFKNPKTDSSRRMIDLGSLTIEVLRNHAVEQKRARLAAGPAWTDEGLVFPALDGSPWKPSNFTSSWIGRVGRIGFARLRFHDLRHTHASQLLHEGINPKVVSARLGRGSVATTMNIYAHALPGDQKQAALVLDAALRAAGEHG